MDAAPVHRVVLVPRHAGDGVVRNDYRAHGTVIHHVQKARHAAVAEGGISKHGNALLRHLNSARLFNAMRNTDGCAHANAGIHRAKRRQCAERIASDIGKHMQLQLVEHMEQRPVRAARAEHGGAHRNVRRRHGAIRLSARKPARNLMCEQLALHAGFRLAMAGNSHRTDRIFKKRLHILYDNEFLHPRCKFTNKPFRQGVCKPEFEHGCMRQSLFHIIVCRAGGNDAQLSLHPFDSVDRKRICIFSKAALPLLHITVAGNHVCRHGHILLRFLFVCKQRKLLPLAEFHRRTRMRYARGKPNDYRRIVPFAQFKCELHERLAFRTVRRVKHRRGHPPQQLPSPRLHPCRSR